MVIDNAVTITTKVYESTEFPYPQGWLKVIMDYTAQCSVTSHDMFNLAGAISVLGHVSGQRFMGPTRVRTNFYNVALGHSGSGKEAPLSAAKKLLRRIGINQYRAIDTVTSEAAVLSTMRDLGPIILLCIDEMGDVFSQAKNRGSNAYKIMTLWKQLFSKTNSSFSKQYAQSRDCFDINGPHVNVLGVSTPDELFTAFGNNNISSGFVPRCLFFPSYHPPQESNFNVRDEGTNEIAENLRIIIKTGPVHNPMLPPRNHNPIMIPESKAAREQRKEWMAYCLAKRRACYTDKVIGAIYNRMDEHGLKLSLLHSISRWDSNNTEDISIEPVDCDWGFGFAEASVNWLAGEASNFTGGNKYENLLNKVHRIIEQYQAEHNKPCSRKHLQANMHLKGNDLDTCLKTLIDAGDIEELPPVKNPNKTVTRLFIIAEEDSDL